MAKITGTQVEEVVEAYLTNNSILATAKITGISTVKVRKILITEELWESDTSRKIKELLKQGMTTEEIAKLLYMSIKNVQAYMPYERGVYGGDELTPDAIRSNKYRQRMKAAASMQVVKSKRKKEISRRMAEMKENKIIQFDEKQNDKLDVLRLHLELNMKYVDEEQMKILRKYGSVNQTISRDILVPADITLHALNYAILRMFGWQNGHLHNFSLPEDVFKELTENQFSAWAKMAGVYFRFPTENFEDIYWDDDYREGESIKTWMKKKYTGPYKYKGHGEHYLINQIEVKDMFERWEEIEVREFLFGVKEQPDPYKVRFEDATVDQVQHAFADVICHELIERLPVADILCVKNRKKINFEEIREYVNSNLSKIDLDSGIGEYQDNRFGSEKKKREFLETYNISVLPITKQLIYSYDYGDGWEVLISCENVYRQDEKGIWEDYNQNIPDVLAENLDKVIENYRPICIAKDGIELVDDVGGIGGFCEMLRTIYEFNKDDEKEMDEREDILGWAEMMGWTGRKISERRTL